jgi:hypothetical protein
VHGASKSRLRRPRTDAERGHDEAQHGRDAQRDVQPAHEAAARDQRPEQRHADDAARLARDYALAQHWVDRVPGTRALRVTDEGRRGFLEQFALNLS